jgi:hypothetical protein
MRHISGCYHSSRKELGVVLTSARQMFEVYQVMVRGKRLKPKDCAEIWYNQQELLGWPPYEFKVDGRDIVNKEEKGEVDLWNGSDIQ